VSTATDRCTGRTLLGTHAHVRGDLTCGLGPLQWQTGPQGTRRGQAQAGNARHHPQSRAERRVGSRQLGQFAIDVGDLASMAASTGACNSVTSAWLAV
jgi:hypothetical protein